MDTTSLKLLRQILKACADDTRLRILQILRKKSLTVNELSQFLKVKQPTVSKHLSRLRLLRMVFDKRVGSAVHYSLNTDTKTLQGRIASFLVSQFADAPAFQKDKEAMRKIGRK